MSSGRIHSALDYEYVVAPLAAKDFQGRMGSRGGQGRRG
jgi:hypothetical protein